MKKCFLFIAALFVLASTCFAADSNETQAFVNPFTTSGNWYKANLHTHSKLSDGDSNLPDVVNKYRKLGYSVLAITDHEKSNDVSGYSDANFILLNGMETHPKCNTSENVYHFVCLNLPNGFVMPTELEAQQRINRVKEAGGEVFFAHPYWSGHNINEIEPLKGLIGIEVYNNLCDSIGKGCGSVQWDDLLLAKHYISGFATDDLHAINTPVGGWVMVKSESLTPEAIMAALKTGCFYSSAGPTIEDFRIENNTIYLRCSPVKEIRLLGNAAHGKKIRTAGSELLTKFKEKIPENSGLRYVRAEIVDVNDRCAWTNPIIIEPPKETK
ncbi:MAG: CehA/McbA family metallohydrolase [Sedimentisphaerales bacterium]